MNAKIERWMYKYCKSVWQARNRRERNSFMTLYTLKSLKLAKIIYFVAYLSSLPPFRTLIQISRPTIVPVRPTPAEQWTIAKNDIIFVLNFLFTWIESLSAENQTKCTSGWKRYTLKFYNYIKNCNKLKMYFVRPVIPEHVIDLKLKCQMKKRIILTVCVLLLGPVILSFVYCRTLPTAFTPPFVTVKEPTVMLCPCSAGQYCSHFFFPLSITQQSIKIAATFSCHT